MQLHDVINKKRKTKTKYYQLIASGLNSNQVNNNIAILFSRFSLDSMIQLFFEAQVILMGTYRHAFILVFILMLNTCEKRQSHNVKSVFSFSSKLNDRHVRTLSLTCQLGSAFNSGFILLCHYFTWYNDYYRKKLRAMKRAIAYQHNKYVLRKAFIRLT